MSEKRILLASLLKPINDTRMYEKLGLSLSKLRNVSISICGYQAPVPAEAPANIAFYPIFSFPRLSIGRLSAQRSFYKLLLQVKPDLIIVATHELLLVSYLYQKLHGGKIVYDIQENYSLNLTAQHHYAAPVKHLLAFGVRSIEQLVSSAVAHFLVAEQSYLQELPFLDERYTLLENKYKPGTRYTLPATPVRLSPDQPLRLLYSGTISETYGVFEAIEFAGQLHQIHPQVQLTIIGYCAKGQTLAQLRESIKDKPYIKLIGGDSLVPHQQIIEEINRSHVGLLPYRPNESTFRCIPTKLYEYMAHGLPVLVQENPLWQPIVEENQAGYSIDFRSVHAAELLQLFRQNPFYGMGIPEFVFWNTEEEKLTQVVQRLL
ncbi:glycosyltransferase [Pontibacter ruber]|uniref:Glycosyltransferase n=1 Tax=Pontibacter ruber TaxID=1343895 RepID=A0ABW5CTI1_9BACT|nr:glycosyltransferase [Pontibacter ruber]